jgi:hypothetical protein
VEWSRRANSDEDTESSLSWRKMEAISALKSLQAATTSMIGNMSQYFLHKLSANNYGNWNAGNVKV